MSWSKLRRALQDAAARAGVGYASHYEPEGLAEALVPHGFPQTLVGPVRVLKGMASELQNGPEPTVQTVQTFNASAERATQAALRVQRGNG